MVDLPATLCELPYITYSQPLQGSRRAKCGRCVLLQKRPKLPQMIPEPMKWIFIGHNLLDVIPVRENSFVTTHYERIQDAYLVHHTSKCVDIGGRRLWWPSLTVGESKPKNWVSPSAILIVCFQNFGRPNAPIQDRHEAKVSEYGFPILSNEYVPLEEYIVSSVYINSESF